MPDETEKEFTTRKCTVRCFDSSPDAREPFNSLWNIRTSEGECKFFPDGAVCYLTMDQEIGNRLDWKYLLFFDDESEGKEVRLVASGTCLVLGILRFVYRLLPDEVGA